MYIESTDVSSFDIAYERFRRQRLPRLISIKKNVDQGEVVSAFDLSFLETCIEDVKSNEHFAQEHPDFGELISEMSSLYHHISEKALENQKETLML